MPGELNEVSAVFRSLALDAPHLPDALLAHLAQNESLDPEEKARVEAHLAACTRCHTDLESLRAYKHTLAGFETESMPVVDAEPAPRPQKPKNAPRQPWIPIALALNALGLGAIYGKVVSGQSATAPKPLTATPQRISSASEPPVNDLGRVRAAYEAQLIQAKTKTMALEKEVAALKARVGSSGAPAPEGIVLAPGKRSVLTWPAVPKASAYRIVVAGPGNNVLFRSETKLPSWKPPKPLQTKTNYRALIQNLDAKSQPFGEIRELRFSLGK
jgi:hypothetical protein